jgi:hypothetical protein
MPCSSVWLTSIGALRLAAGDMLLLASGADSTGRPSVRAWADDLSPQQSLDRRLLRMPPVARLLEHGGWHALKGRAYRLGGAWRRENWEG